MKCDKRGCYKPNKAESIYCQEHMYLALPKAQQFVYLYCLQSLREAMAKGLNRSHMKRRAAPYSRLGDSLWKIAHEHSLAIAEEVAELLLGSIKPISVESRINSLLNQIQEVVKKGD